MEGVELVLALGLLLFQASGTVHGLGKLGHLLRGGLAVDVTQQPADDRALALDHSAHAPLLPGLGIAPGLTVQPQAGAGITLAQLDAGLGGSRLATCSTMPSQSIASASRTSGLLCRMVW